MRAEDWISVEERVPEDRRRVAVWIETSLAPLFARWGGRGRIDQSRYNPSPRGGQFDADYSGRFVVQRVTHWQEIVAPPEPAVAPPPKAP